MIQLQPAFILPPSSKNYLFHLTACSTAFRPAFSSITQYFKTNQASPLSLSAFTLGGVFYREMVQASADVEKKGLTQHYTVTIATMTSWQVEISQL